MQSGAALDAMPVLQDSQGTIAFQLKATSSNHAEVLDVQVCSCFPAYAHRLPLGVLAYLNSVVAYHL